MENGTPDWSSPFDARSTTDQVLAGVDLEGRTAVVTGANSGLGLETSRALAAKGARVLLACRDRERGQAAVERLHQSESGLDLEVRELDLADFASVRSFAHGIGDLPIDMLICNAGIFASKYRETADGFESTVGICHLGHFLLVHELSANVEASRLRRVVLVSSEAHRQIRDLDLASDLPLDADSYSAMRAYAQAKLCNVLHAAELQRRFGDGGLSVFSLHPGNLVPTRIGRDSLLVNLLIQLIRPFTKSVKQGAATSVLCAAHPAVAPLGGSYFSDCRPRRPSRLAQRPELAAELWKKSVAWTGVNGG